MDKVEHSEQHPRYRAFDTGYLPVSDGHKLYYEQAGNPDGVPVVCLHGREPGRMHGRGGSLIPTIIA